MSKMPEIDLTTKVGRLFTLRHPFWIASAHYTEKESAIESWKEVQPAALTLKTASTVRTLKEKKRIREKTLAILPRFGYSLYCDGAKQDEYLTYEGAADLLGKAQKALPETLVGISVLAGPDEKYDSWRNFVLEHNSAN